MSPLGGRFLLNFSTSGIIPSVTTPAINATKSITPLSTVRISTGSTRTVYQRQTKPITSAAIVERSDNIHATLAATAVRDSAASCNSLGVSRFALFGFFFFFLLNVESPNRASASLGVPILNREWELVATARFGRALFVVRRANEDEAIRELAFVHPCRRTGLSIQTHFVA